MKPAAQQASVVSIHHTEIPTTASKFLHPLRNSHAVGPQQAPPHLKARRESAANFAVEHESLSPGAAAGRDKGKLQSLVNDSEAARILRLLRAQIEFITSFAEFEGSIVLHCLINDGFCEPLSRR
jgi:hypothetical protein